MNLPKRTLILIATVFGLALSSTARPVDLETAKSVASKFMGTEDLHLAATYTTDRDDAAFYVFNTSNGFVIVSADDCETPIIGYSREGRFNPDDVPVQMEDYLQDFVARIQYGIENNIEADKFTARQWDLVKATGKLNERKGTRAVEPLLTEKWHQGCLYNSLCPEMSGPCGHAEVGCVAVAMGQIMHYWGYPATGWGSHSYYNQGIQLSADFGNTLYNWELMPDSLTESSSEEKIEAVATLLYHCGVSVDMKYTTDGSGADSGDVPNALIRYFNYSRQLHIERRKDYSDDEWIAMMKSCINLQRPVFYGGKGGQGSHAFVCDGYDGNNLLHFNWGWGRADGYFALGHLNPIDYSFNEKNFAILDIFPQYDPCVVNAMAYPPTAGTIEGNGGYHIGEQCTLTAVTNENSTFRYWKQDGRVVSYYTTFSFLVTDDVDNIEACFALNPLKEINAYYAPDTNDMNSPYANLSWDYDSIRSLKLLKQFDLGEYPQGITTDNEYIYTSKCVFDTLYHLKLNKYTMNGDLVDSFGLDKVNVQNITTDGNYIYFCNNCIYSKYLYCTDFIHKAITDSLFVNFRADHCVYDPENDSFWLDEIMGNKIRLVDRQGQTVCFGPNFSTLQSDGFGSIVAEDGSPHLLILDGRRLINYDIIDESFYNNQLGFVSIDVISAGACIGKYGGKDALFVLNSIYTNSSILSVFEIDCHLAPVKHYRLYRSDSLGNKETLADECTSTSFTDTTWENAATGTYRFGISEVYFNGIESDIIWSDPIVKTNIGINENTEEQGDTEPSVRKVFENGQVVIIKDGKRYNVSGQALNRR